MRLEHITQMEAGYTMGMNPDGRELLVVVVKGTFQISDSGHPPVLAPEQIRLFEADDFTGEPGLSAPLHESDYAPFKPMCDVILNGSAYAPGGRPAPKVRVMLQIGPVAKFFHVVGPRFWQKGMISISPTRPIPFTVMPFSYDTAFGGVDFSHSNEKKHKAFMENPIGKGFHDNLKNEEIHGTPLPNTEELKNPVTRPDGPYRPMGFGVVGRGWLPRYPLAGTYDQAWLDNAFPFLPADFDSAYFQCAPADQQMPYPKGGESVGLLNLTPEGKTVFQLPSKEITVTYFLKNGEEKDVAANLDTLVIEPDRGIFTLTWRASLPLKKNMFEVEFALVAESAADRETIFQKKNVSFPLFDTEDEDFSHKVPEVREYT
nr:DUF2169 domain-containing protein [uncultured Desulfobacter sp.]